MTKIEAPLWRAIIQRLNPPPASESLDSVHIALRKVVGRGTVQRIRQGRPGTSLQSIKTIAHRLGCDPSELLAFTEHNDAEATKPHQVAEPTPDVLELLDEFLLTIPEQNRPAVSSTLSQWALYPGQTQWADSIRALQIVKANIKVNEK